MKITPNAEWHHLSGDVVTSMLTSSREKGLSPDKVRQRLEQFGHNTLTVQQGRSALMRFIFQFHQPLIYILLVAGAITAALQEWVDS